MDTPGRQKWIEELKRWILRRVTEYQKLDLVEGSNPSEAQKVAEQEESGMGSPGHSKS
jgi:hypothetical protein